MVSIARRQRSSSKLENKTLRLKLPVGMTRRDRQPEDDPNAIEVWLQQADPADRPREKH